MVVFPNAKINLGLNVVGKRPDGFHDIETLFYPVGLCDALEIVPAVDGIFDFSVSGLRVAGDPSENLCVKAFRLLSSTQKAPLSPVKIHLHKVIPMGSGLGGGSSDGAFTLMLLNDLFGLGIGEEALKELARQLGSDCAFFIGNRPAFAFGRGDHFSPAEICLRGYCLGIAVPPVHSDTATAYRMLTPGRFQTPVFETITNPVNHWRERLFNDFEPVIFSTFPEVGKLKDKMYECGAVYASMSGSGSAVYGIFGEEPDMENLFPGCFTWREWIRN